jgi:hypothetical protein
MLGKTSKENPQKQKLFDEGITLTGHPHVLSLSLHFRGLFGKSLVSKISHPSTDDKLGLGARFDPR